MFKGYVFPIGQKPDNQSWTGFQCHNADSGCGYLTIFREVNNAEPQQAICLKFLGGKKIMLTDLRTGEISNINISDNHKVIFSIDNRADFRFYRYDILKNNKP